MTRQDELLEVGRWQAGYCRELGAPTWGAVVDAVLTGLDASADTAATRLLLTDDGSPLGTMVWLRFLGSVHRLVLDDPASEPSQWFRTAGGVTHPVAAVPAVLAFVEDHEEGLGVEMRRPVQTNEVGRSAPLAAAMGWLGGDLHLREVGASAGLNLWLDRHRVVGDGFAWGPPDSPLVFEGMFASGRPDVQPFRVVSRAGCDRAPLDVTNPADRRLLRSFVWCDHAERLARLETAMALSGAVELTAANLVDWTRTVLTALPEGRSVVYHSIVMTYLDVDARQAFSDALDAAGATADVRRGLAHVSYESAGRGTELVVRRWPEGDVHRLATLSGHGAGIRWHPEIVPAAL